ncbi:putative protein of unknown function (DUF952) [Lyophyllum shimeji]|uniref:DUF952 domain-containing protein n=1 Tax=Lyophyllum shimeji TaxID=47721 RepID=A0A9P3PCY3_LYOSH|nr:putative protein of unknown function (DUF952) [Lyophyllum shimeji]
MSRTPTYIYKLVPPDLIVLPLPERLPLSQLDANDGFIHLSTAVQLPETLRRYFANEMKMYILRLEYKHVEKDIRWEDPRGKDPGDIGAEGIYPHLHNGGQLGSEEVEDVFVLERGGEDWDIEKIRNSEWLVY